MDVVALSGPNFSGRSARMRAWAGLAETVGAEPVCRGNAYVGPDPIDSLSGLAPTVSAEFELAAVDSGACQAVRRAAQDLGFGYLLTRNPFTLSGGEQVLTAVLAAAAGRPKRLAIDCALEQLAAPTRNALLEWLVDWAGELMLADNRLADWYEGPTIEMESAPDAPTLRSDLATGASLSLPEVEISNLSFAYPGAAPVFADFSLKLEAGVTYHLRGPNGAGKTTLSKLLCGLLKPQGGEIKVDGQRVEPWRCPGSFVGYHFQNPSFQLFARTVAAQLRFAPDVAHFAARFGLAPSLDLHPLDLPFVLRKRVALAATASRQTGFLVLDEPTLGQDRSTCDHLSRLLNGHGGLRISHSQVYDHLPFIMLG